MYVIRTKDSYVIGTFSGVNHPTLRSINAVLKDYEIDPVIYPILMNAELEVVKFKNHLNFTINTVDWNTPSIFADKEDKIKMESLLEEIYVQPLSDFLNEIKLLIENTYTVIIEDENVTT